MKSELCARIIASERCGDKNTTNGAYEHRNQTPEKAEAEYLCNAFTEIDCPKPALIRRNAQMLL